MTARQRSGAGSDDGALGELADRLSEGLDSLRREMAEFAGTISEESVRITGEAGKVSAGAAAAGEALSGVSAEVAALREHVARQQVQLRRWQEGYDWQVLRRVCSRLLRVADDLERKAADSEGETADALSVAREHILIVLEDEGIEELRLTPGQEYAGMEKVAKVVGRPAAPGPDMAGRVAEVLSPGFIRVDGDGTARVLRPARVTVHGEAEGKE